MAAKSQEHCLLGIDVGTTHCKAALFDHEGHQISVCRAETPTYRNANGGAVHHADEIWDVVCAAIRRALDQAHTGGCFKTAGESCVLEAPSVDAVSVTSMGEAGVPLGAKGEPLFPVIAWFDSRSQSQCQEFARFISTREFFNVTGLDLTPIFSVFKLMWLADNYPEVFTKMRKWLCMTDFIYYKLTSVFATDYTIAHRTGVFDINTLTWDSDLCRASNFNPDSLPQIFPSGTIIGKVTGPASKATSLLRGTPVIIGGHDQLCAALAVGASSNRFLNSSGTAETLLAVLGSQRPSIERTFANRLRVGPSLSGNRYYVLASFPGSGASFEWMVGRLAEARSSTTNRSFADRSAEPAAGPVADKILRPSDADYEHAIRAASLSPAGSRGLLFIPHLRGSGPPDWNLAARGAVLGLRSHHKNEDLVRAVIEGLCFEVRWLAQIIKGASGVYPSTLATTGGGARSDLWLRTKADITSASIEVPQTMESAAQGAAMLAGVGVGIYDSPEDAQLKVYRSLVQYHPRAFGDAKATYSRLFDAYCEARTLLHSIDERLIEP